jgi:hypothetical protein
MLRQPPALVLLSGGPLMYGGRSQVIWAGILCEIAQIFLYNLTHDFLNLYGLFYFCCIFIVL